MARSIAASLHKGDKVSIPLDTHPEHAAALGRLLGHWAFLETQLMGVLQALLYTSQRKSKFVWQEFNSARGKIELAQRLNFHFTGDASLKDDLDKLLAQAQSLNGMRNNYIHALWVDPGGSDNTLERMSNSLEGNYKKEDKKWVPLTPENIQDDVAKLAVLSQALADWQSRFVAKFGAPPEQ